MTETLRQKLERGAADGSLVIEPKKGAAAVEQLADQDTRDVFYRHTQV